MENKTIVYESEAIAEAMDIGSLPALVSLNVKDGKLASAILIHDLTTMYEGNNAFRKEVDELIKK